MNFRLVIASLLVPVFGCSPDGTSPEYGPRGIPALVLDFPDALPTLDASQAPAAIRSHGDAIPPEALVQCNGKVVAGGRPLPRIVSVLVTQNRQGKQIVAASTTGIAQVSTAEETSYTVQLEGPATPGAYQVFVMLGDLTVGVADLTVQ